MPPALTRFARWYVKSRTQATTTYVMAQVGHTDPTLTLRIYQQLLKRRRREEYRERVNELLGTSPAATGSAHAGPNSGPNSLLVRGGRSALP